MVYRAICRNTDRKGAQTQHRKGACWAGGMCLLLVGSACVRGRGSVCVCVLPYAKISYEMCCEIQFSWIFIYFASLLARGTCPATPPPTPSCWLCPCPCPCPCLWHSHSRPSLSWWLTQTGAHRCSYISHAAAAMPSLPPPPAIARVQEGKGRWGVKGAGECFRAV